MRHQEIIRNAPALIAQAVKRGWISYKPPEPEVVKPPPKLSPKTIRDRITGAKRREAFWKLGLNSKGKPFKRDPLRYAHITESDRNKRIVAIRREKKKLGI